MKMSNAGWRCCFVIVLGILCGCETVVVPPEPITDTRLRDSAEPYTMVKFNKVQGETCQYDFEVRLTENSAANAIAEKVRTKIRSSIMKEFLGSNGHDRVDDVRISFLSWYQSESLIKGSAVVFKMRVVRSEYDASIGCGKIVVRFDGRDMKAAREWVREKIAELVADKNVTFVAGKPPPGVRYKIGSERMTEDGLLEVMFFTRGDGE